jgi:hypothetical protein
MVGRKCLDGLKKNMIAANSFLWRSIAYFTDAEEDVAIDGYEPYTKNWEEIKSYILKNCL